MSDAEYRAEYAKKYYKRIQLRFQHDYFKTIAEIAEALDEPITVFIKRAIAERLERDEGIAPPDSLSL